MPASASRSRWRSFEAESTAVSGEIGCGRPSLAAIRAAALGKEIATRRRRPSQRAGGACVRFLSGAGEADGLARAEAIPGVAWARIYGGSERAGAVLAVGASRDEALERATHAAECIRFRAADAQAV